MKTVSMAFLVVFLVCTTAMAAGPIRIAALFSTSGEAQAISEEHLTVVRFAVDEINRSGGILNQPIELIELNNESTALGARQAAREAVKSGVVAVIGPSWSSHAMGCAPVLQAARIPMITPTATNPDVTRVGDYIFRVCFVDSFQGEMLAKFAVTDLGLTTMAVLTNTDQVYSIGLSKTFSQRFRALGGTITAELEYIENLSGYDDLVTAVSGHRQGGVFLPGYARDSAQIVKTAREMKLTEVFLGGDGWSNLMFNYAGNELDGSYYLTHWHKDLDDPASIAFVAKIRHLADASRINAGMALSYDAVYLLKDAIIRAGSPQPHAIREALAQTQDFSGITGRIGFDADRNPVKPAVILEFKNRNSTVVKQIHP